MVKLNKIYTRTGDDGTTGLADGSRRLKNNLRVAAYGEVDEANSFIGLLCAGLTTLLPTAEAAAQKTPIEKLLKIFTAVQNDLFDLGADLAKPLALDQEGSHDLRISQQQVAWLEKSIDEWNGGLPPLTSFILPGGGQAAALAHIARTVVRRAERAAVALQGEEDINPLAVQYLNRLSDLLFVVARVMARDGAFGGQGEVLWKPGQNC